MKAPDSVIALVVLLVVCLFVAVPRALAEDAELARSLFEEADRALDEGRFAAARDLLRRSLVEFPQPATAFNLAVALRGTGELREASRLLHQLFEGELGDLDAERRAQVGRLRDEVRAELGALRVRACGVPTPSLRIDGEPTSQLEECEWRDLAMDPGVHLLRFEAPHARPVERRLMLRSAEHFVLEVPMELLPTASTPWFESPWLYVGLGAVVAAGLAIALVVALAPPTNAHVTDDVFGEIIALQDKSLGF